MSDEYGSDAEPICSSCELKQLKQTWMKKEAELLKLCVDFQKELDGMAGISWGAEFYRDVKKLLDDGGWTMIEIPSDLIQKLVKLIHSKDLDIDGVAKYCALDDLNCLEKWTQKLITQRKLQLSEKKVRSI